MIVFNADQVLHVLPFLSVTAGVVVLFVGKLLNEHVAVRLALCISSPASRSTLN